MPSRNHRSKYWTYDRARRYVGTWCVVHLHAQNSCTHHVWYISAESSRSSHNLGAALRILLLEIWEVGKGKVQMSKSRLMVVQDEALELSPYHLVRCEPFLVISVFNVSFMLLFSFSSVSLAFLRCMSGKVEPPCMLTVNLGWYTYTYIRCFSSLKWFSPGAS